MPSNAKSQTQGASPPAPPSCERQADRFAGGGVVAGAGPLPTLAVPEVPPQRPHPLGEARPLWERRGSVCAAAGATRRVTPIALPHSTFGVGCSMFGVRLSTVAEVCNTNAEHRVPNIERRMNADRAATPLPPLQQGACLATEVGALGRKRRHGESKSGFRPRYSITAREAVLIPTGGCGRGTPLLRLRFRIQRFFNELTTEKPGRRHDESV